MKVSSAIVLIVILIIVGALYFVPDRMTTSVPPMSRSGISPNGAPVIPSRPGDVLLDGYGIDGTSPLEDVRKIHRVITSYFSVVKDATIYPIGGNRDLTAVLLGENLNREAMISEDNPALGPEGELIDRWRTPLFIHPMGAKSLEVRSAGPDTEMFTADDLVILPTGVPGSAEFSNP